MQLSVKFPCDSMLSVSCQIARCGYLSAGSREGCKPVSLRNPILIEQFESGNRPFELMRAQVAQRDRLVRLSAAPDVNARAELAELPVHTGASRTGINLPYAHRLQLALCPQSANVKPL